MSFLDPRAIMMLFVAGLLDLFGVICLLLDIAFGVGEVLSYIPDVIGILFFGMWIFILSQGEKSKEESKEELTKKVAKTRAEQKMQIEKAQKKVMGKMAKKGSKRGLRFALATLGELLPFIGALPFWTIFVYLEIKKS